MSLACKIDTVNISNPALHTGLLILNPYEIYKLRACNSQAQRALTLITTGAACGLAIMPDNKGL